MEFYANSKDESLPEISRAGFIIIRLLDGQIQSLNGAVTEIIGITTDEWIGHNFWDLDIWADSPTQKQSLEKLCKGQDVPGFETSLKRKDGDLRTVWVSAYPMVLANEKYLLIEMIDITDVQTAFADLKSSETSFRQLAENAQDLVYRYELSPEPGFSYVSPSATRITGYTPQEHYADPDLGFKLVHPDDRPMLAGLSAGEIDRDKPITLRWIKKDGTVIWCEQTNVPVFDENGSLIALEGIARDITRERKAELKYEDLFNQMPNAFALHEIITDDKGKAVNYRFLQVNPAFEDQTGLKKEDIIGKTVLGVLPKTEMHWIEDYGRVALEGTSLQLSSYAQELDKYYEVYAYQHAPNQFATIFRDITEIKKTEESLRHTHDLLRYVIEHSNGAVAVHDRDLRYIYVSQRYLKDYKIQDNDIIGKHHYEVFPDLPQKWREVHQRVLKGEVCRADEDAYEKADGTTEWTRWECRPWYEAEGTIGGIIVYTEVITQRKNEEDELRKLKTDLEIQVAEKTKDLNERIAELEHFYNATIEREFRLKELREEIKQLRNEKNK